MKDRATKFWVIVASKDHVKSAVDQSIAQTCHRKSAPLKRMHSDFVMFYSGKQTLGKTEKCQEFTALGKVLDDEINTFQASADFCHSRRDIEFLKTEDISILPLIDDLEFIQNKSSWGMLFRFGFLEINEHDFSLISSKMLKK